MKKLLVLIILLFSATHILNAVVTEEEILEINKIQTTIDLLRTQLINTWRNFASLPFEQRELERPNYQINISNFTKAIRKHEEQLKAFSKEALEEAAKVRKKQLAEKVW